VKVACTDSSGGVACKGGLYRDLIFPILSILIITFKSIEKEIYKTALFFS
jgi:hypothetical protein